MAIFPEFQSYTIYGEESSYGVAPGAVISHFGLVQRSTPRINNQYKRYKGVGDGRNASRVEVGGLLDAGINTSFQVFDGSFLKYFFGSVSGTGSGGDPFIYAESDTVDSLTIEKAYDLGTDQVLRFLGSMCKRLTLRARLGEPLEADMEFDSQSVSKNNTYQSVTVPSTALYIFTHGSLEIPTSNTIIEIQEISLTMDNKTRRTGGIGSRLSTVRVSDREYSGNFKRWISDNVHLEDVMGGASSVSAGTPATTATLRLNFTDGSRNILVTFNTLNFDWEGTDELAREIEENVNFTALSAGATEVT